MYKILKREQFGPATFLWEVEAPAVAKACEPGHFVMVRIDENGERIPLTVADFDAKRGTVTLVTQAIGKTTYQMMDMKVGDEIIDFIGPLGLPAPIDDKKKKVVLVGGGLGVAPVYPQLRAFKALGAHTISIVGFRSKDLIFWSDKFEEYSDEAYVATDDGSFGTKGFVTTILQKVMADNDDIDEVVAIGPLVMMKACVDLTKPKKLPTMVSLNSIMVDGTGMCGSCRVTVGGRMKFACVDGPDVDGLKVDFDELLKRQERFGPEEQESLERYRSKQAKHACVCEAKNRDLFELPTPLPIPEGKQKQKKLKEIPQERTGMPEQDAKERATNFEEVALGYDMEMALNESERCIMCKKPKCIPLCPVEIDIPKFIKEVAHKDFKAAYRTLKKDNALPAICGRVCPQEIQCEMECIVGKKLAPVAVGRLERYVADIAMGRGWDERPEITPTGKKAAIIGSGPAGLSCANDLIRAGVETTVFEALHVAGGVLKYGIPEFRLPNEIIDIEIGALADLGVKFELNSVIGKLFTIPQLMEEMGYDSVFIGTGAGTPKFMNIPGEGLNGIYSANEFLTRVNLMQGYKHPEFDTPVGMGRRVAVIGAGNTAMDAARISLRLGAEAVYLVYRRTIKESPARAEELHHAIEEGVVFKWLTNPIRQIGEERVEAMEVIEMELGEPDDSGRRRPLPKEGSEHILEVDTVIYALGTASNPIIAQTTPGLDINKWGYIDVDETGMTNMPGVFAGGDIVTGAATVILAMGAGRVAARGMMKFMGLAKEEAKPEETSDDA